jgi:hypothetical protein
VRLVVRIRGSEAVGQVVALSDMSVVARLIARWAWRTQLKAPVDGNPLDLADALTEAAQAINRHTSLEETLDAIVHATRSSVPGFTDVGISITQPGREDRDHVRHRPTGVGARRHPVQAGGGSVRRLGAAGAHRRRRERSPRRALAPLHAPSGPAGAPLPTCPAPLIRTARPWACSTCTPPPPTGSTPRPCTQRASSTSNIKGCMGGEKLRCRWPVR